MEVFCGKGFLPSLTISDAAVERLNDTTAFKAEPPIAKEFTNFFREKKVSLFNAGYKNTKGLPVLQTKPCADVTILDLYHYIIGEDARAATEAIRAEKDPDRRRALKTLMLMFCIPFGTFSYRKRDKLLQPSGLMVIDIDDIDDPAMLARLKRLLPHDKRYETELLFTSPGGEGLKAFIRIGMLNGRPLRDVFAEVDRHLRFEYGINADASGKDEARACFLCYDPDCYINPKYLENTASNCTNNEHNNISLL